MSEEGPEEKPEEKLEEEKPGRGGQENWEYSLPFGTWTPYIVWLIVGALLFIPPLLIWLNNKHDPVSEYIDYYGGMPCCLSFLILLWTFSGRRGFWRSY